MKIIILFFFLVISVLLFSEEFQSSEITVIKDYSISESYSTPVRISPNANYKGIVQPGRNVISHGDTICVIYSNTTSDPNNFQRFMQAYSTDNGATWIIATIGTQDVTKTYPDMDQLIDLCSYDPLNVNPYIVWIEVIYPTNKSVINFSKDDYVPYSLFTPVPIDNSQGSFPTIMAWGGGETLLVTTITDSFDIFTYRSIDSGQNWVKGVYLSSIGTSEGQVGAMIDNGNNGYGIAFYGKQENAGDNIQAYYKETTDYGVTWTSSETLISVIADQTLSMSLTGYSCVVDPFTNMPYFLLKLDTSKNCSQSYNFGELYFIKPSGGSPGSYIFDHSNPVKIVTGIDSIFEHIAGFPTIGTCLNSWSYDSTLYGFFNAYADTVIGNDTITTLEIFATISSDGGVIWNNYLITPAFDTSFQKNFASSSPYSIGIYPNLNIDLVFCECVNANNTDHLDLYYMNVDIISLGIEEKVEENISVFNVSTIAMNGICRLNISLPESGNTKVEIFDTSGRIVTEVVNQYLSKGEYSFDWNYKNSASGIYLYRMSSSGFITSGKVIIVE